MVEELNLLAEDKKAWVSSRAKNALILYDQWIGGGLDEWEYKELMERIVQDPKLDIEADDLDTKQLLVTAVYSVAEMI